MLSFSGDKYKGVPGESVVNTKVRYFSMFHGVNKKLSLMSLARDTRLIASLGEDLVV